MNHLFMLTRAPEALSFAAGALKGEREHLTQVALSTPFFDRSHFTRGTGAKSSSQCSS